MYVLLPLYEVLQGARLARGAGIAGAPTSRQAMSYQAHLARGA